MAESPVLWSGALFKKSRRNPPRHQISPVIALEPPFALPPYLECEDRWEAAALYPLSALRSFKLVHSGRGHHTRGEWQKFLRFLQSTARVAVVHLDGWELIIEVPSPAHLLRLEAVVHYRSTEACSSATVEHQEVGQEAAVRTVATRRAETHPGFLDSLRQTHASWLFGAIAELVDNARDAKANRLSISVVVGVLRGQTIPIFCMEDDGCGMDPEETRLMLTFGHGKPESAKNTKRIGRFGVGFKSGSMQIGKDAIVLTQCAGTRSLAFFSTSYNEGKEVLEIPKVTWRRRSCGGMDLDLTTQSASDAESSLEAVLKHSPFDRQRIDNEFDKINDTGTRIFIYNLDRWGAEYKLRWEGDDISIRSERVRSRPGQTSDKVILDFSLRSYLEVLFLVPEMEILVNGTQVRTRRLDKSLPRPQVVKKNIMGAELTLTIGFSEEEKERGNCGVFLYWHGRLIEAYKRVGGMLHSADMRGVIGVVETTPLMTTESWVGVLNTKQGFEDSAQYAELELWLAATCDKYWEDNFENEHHMLDDLNAPLEAKSEWVQCEKCRKWRRMPEPDKSVVLPDQWFCYMPPFLGSCSTPEEVQEEAEWTTAVGRNDGRPETGKVVEGPKRKVASNGRKIATGHHRAKKRARNEVVRPQTRVQ